jgi:hypothetical protein
MWFIVVVGDGACSAKRVAAVNRDPGTPRPGASPPVDAVAPAGAGDAAAAGPEVAAGTREAADPNAILRGLDENEVAQRRAAGQRNVVERSTSRSVEEIVRANIFTRFNAILGALLVVILAVREYRDALFGVVLVLNAGIGIVQELRAKRTLDELSVVSAPKARVVRGGRVIEIPGDEIVLDDVLAVASGDQIVVDGVVLDALGLEIDDQVTTCVRAASSPRGPVTSRRRPSARRPMPTSWRPRQSSSPSFAASCAQGSTASWSSSSGC